MFVAAPAAPAALPRVADDVLLIWEGDVFRRVPRAPPVVVAARERVLARVLAVDDEFVTCTPLARPENRDAGFGPWVELRVGLACVCEVRPRAGRI